jgi:glutamate dehydrogenase
MTDDIERLVLRDNTLQTHLLVRELQAQGESVQDGYAALIASLEEEGALSRELEQLPSVAELARRKADGRGLTTPELAVVIANVKNRYKRILSALPLTDETWAEPVLAVLPVPAGGNPFGAGAPAGQRHPGHRAGQ